jgi:hypothetical protein
MKKNNKGFSLVELIIVIAIMAILAGALAPALIKYINKSRRSTDIQNADTLRTSVQTAMSNPDAVDAIGGDTTSFSSNDIKNASSSDKFLSEVQSVVGKTTLTTKYKEKGCAFKIDVDIASNTVVVKSTKGTEISPSATTPWAD